MATFKITMLIVAIACISCGREDTFRGRVVNKQRIAADCKLNYNHNENGGTIICDEERLALTLDDNDSFGGGRYCYVSDRVFQETEVGSIYTCQYGADK
jgi:hypothetical protein